MQNCHLIDVKESIYSHIYSQLSLLMRGKGKDSSSSSSNNNNLDETKGLLNEKFDDFSKKHISVEEKFDNIARAIYIKMEEIKKKAEDAKANASNNSDEIESLKFEMKKQSEKISKQFETISELESEIKELKNRSLIKNLIFKNIIYQQANRAPGPTPSRF